MNYSNNLSDLNELDKARKDVEADIIASESGYLPSIKHLTNDIRNLTKEIRDITKEQKEFIKKSSKKSGYIARTGLTASIISLALVFTNLLHSFNVF